VPELMELLKAPDPNLRLAAARAVMRIRPDQTASAIPALKEMLASENNPTVRRAAISSLQYLTMEKNAREKKEAVGSSNR
jgi:HEAT repeat protein